MSIAVPRRVFFVLAIVAGALSGALYFSATQRVDIVVLARDVDVPRPLLAEDVELRALGADLVPDDAVRGLGDVVGLVPRAPMLRGQIVLARSVSHELADFRSGQTLASGYRAIAIPVNAVAAVGGAIVPGSRVDVLAVPIAGRAPAGRSAEILVTNATVLDVRGESGFAYVQRDAKASGGTIDRIASVVIAIAFVDEARLADRVATSTFVLALLGAR
jgi:Flp pilus assembly protein CpaB